MGGNTPFTLLGDQPLIPELPPRPSFAQRIQRAHELSGRHPGAAELLRFYFRLAFYQQHVFDSLGQSRETGSPLFPADGKSGGASSDDQRVAPSFSRQRQAGTTDSANPWPLLIELALPLFPDFARLLADISPTPMRDRASNLAAANAVEQTHLLTRFWNDGFAQDSTALAPADRFIALAFLQPYAEWLAQSGHSTSAAMRHATCSICASEPICAVLRDQDHGARRSLVCSLCMNEWTFPRVVCPACGEDRFESLPVFTPQEIPHVRIDACESCHHYIKTIDMTKDGLAVPIVDELAAVSLDLWAADNGYKKLTLNLAGV